jgi:hypothetical protein
MGNEVPYVADVVRTILLELEVRDIVLTQQHSIQYKA